METVRYRPGEAIRWLQIESARLKDEPGPVMGQTVGESVRGVAGALFNMGRSAFAELAHLRTSASEYMLLEDRLEIVHGKSIRAVPFESIKTIEMKGDRVTLRLEKGVIAIKPFAYIVAGPLKVPIGWNRNGMEVHYHLLIEELSARCGVEVVAV
jgi:hypothetical protein